MRTVALLAEGVDRNAQLVGQFDTLFESPSSRRAWIEMRWECSQRLLQSVALLAEGVDRNLH